MGVDSFSTLKFLMNARNLNDILSTLNETRHHVTFKTTGVGIYVQFVTR